MGIPTSEVGYTSAMPRRKDHKVHKDMWGHWEEKKKKTVSRTFMYIFACVLLEVHSEYIMGWWFMVVHMFSP